ncbi:MAG: hypothetical protein J6P62_05680 [Bacteroidales bacterium]|nr:hypothetical protein [Bacteroidales bacterium]
MPYVNNDKSFASSGVGTAALTTGIIGTALGSGILNGGFAGLFGGNQNPAASPVYQLAQKDTVIEKLEAERYADQQLNLVQIELSNIKQRLAAMEAAAPLREKILGDSILALQANLGNISGYMVKASALPET